MNSLPLPLPARAGHGRVFSPASNRRGKQAAHANNSHDFVLKRAHVVVGCLYSAKWPLFLAAVTAFYNPFAKRRSSVRVVRTSALHQQGVSRNVQVRKMKNTVPMYLVVLGIKYILWGTWAPNLMVLDMLGVGIRGTLSAHTLLNAPLKRHASIIIILAGSEDCRACDNLHLVQPAKFRNSNQNPLS